MWQSRCVIWRWLPPTSISSLTTRSRLGAIERSFDQREQLLRLALGVELALDLASCFGAEGIAEPDIVEQSRERIRERRHVARWNEQAAPIGLDQFRNAGYERADRWRAGGHRF